MPQNDINKASMANAIAKADKKLQQKALTDTTAPIFSDMDLYKNTGLKRDGIMNAMFGDYVNRYDTYLPGADNERLNYENQNWAEALGNGIGGMVFNAGTSLTGYYDANRKKLNAIKQGDYSKLWDDEFSEEDYKGRNAMMDYFAVYDSGEKADGILGGLTKLATKDGVGNFLQSLGFTVGTAAGMITETLAVDAMIEASTAGTGTPVAAAYTGYRLGKLAKFVGGSLYNVVKGLRNADKTFDALRTANAGITGIQAAKALGKGAVSLHRLSSAVVSEGGMESKGASMEYIEDQIEQYKQKYGVEPPQEFIDEVKKNAVSVGNYTFAVNAPTLIFSDMLMFGSLLKTGKFAALLGKTTTSSVGEVVIKEGVAKTAKEAAKEAAKTGAKGLMGKALGTGKSILASGLPEMGEEMMQGIGSAAAKNHYDLFTSPSSKTFIGGLGTLVETGADKLNLVDGELWQEGWSGFATGALMKGIGFFGGAKSRKKKEEQDSKLVSTLNYDNAQAGKMIDSLVGGSDFSTTLGSPTSRQRRNKPSESSLRTLRHIENGATQMNATTGMLAAEVQQDEKLYNDWKNESLKSQLRTNAQLDKVDAGIEIFAYKVDNFDNQDYAKQFMGVDNASEADVKAHKAKVKSEFAQKQTQFKKDYESLKLKAKSYQKPYDNIKDPSLRAIKQEQYDRMLTDIVFYKQDSDNSFERMSSVMDRFQDEIKSLNKQNVSYREADMKVIIDASERDKELARVNEMIATKEAIVNNTTESSILPQEKQELEALKEKQRILQGMQDVKGKNAPARISTNAEKNSYNNLAKEWIKLTTGQDIVEETEINKLLTDIIDLEEEGRFFLTLYNSLLGDKKAFDIYTFGYLNEQEKNYRRAKQEVKEKEANESPEVPKAPISERERTDKKESDKKDFDSKFTEQRNTDRFDRGGKTNKLPEDNRVALDIEDYYFGEQDTISVVEFIDKVIANPLVSKAVKDILVKMKPFIPATAQIKSTDDVLSIGQLGRYIDGSNQIQVSPLAQSATNRSFEEIALNKITQLLTADYISRNPNSDIVKELLEVYGKISTSVETTATSGQQMYGVQDVYEMIAEAFSNPEFQEALSKIEGIEKKTLWDDVINIINKILKDIGVTTIPNSALSNVVGLTYDIISQNKVEEVEVVETLEEVTTEEKFPIMETSPASNQSEIDAKRAERSKKINFINENNGKQVIVNGNEGVLTILNNNRIEIETDNRIYEYEINDIKTYELPKEQPIKYQVNNISETAVTVNGVSYVINIDSNGNVNSLSPSNNLEQNITNEKLIVAVEIERNKLDIERSKEISITNAYEEMIEEGDVEFKDVDILLESIFNNNMTEVIDNALEKLYNEQNLSNNEQLQLSLWLIDAFDRVSIALTNANDIQKEALVNAYNSLESINNLLYKNENLNTNKNGKTNKRTELVKDIENNVNAKKDETRIRQEAARDKQEKINNLQEPNQIVEESKPIDLQEQEESKQIDVQNEGSVGVGGFDFDKLFTEQENKTPEQKELERQDAIDEERESDYQKSSFDKKWAKTYKEAKKKLIEQYNKAKTTKEEWEAKKYKSAGDKSVFVGGELEGNNVSVDAINQKKKASAIKNAQSEMDSAKKDLVSLGLTDVEVEQSLKETPQAGSINEGVNEGIIPLESVEATAKALEGMDEKLTDTPSLKNVKIVLLENANLSAIEETKSIEAINENNENDSWGKALRKGAENLSNGWFRVGKTIQGESILYSPKKNKAVVLKGAKSDAIAVNDFVKNNFGNPQKISEAYHKAKQDGSNPELVKAVEDILGQKTSPSVQVTNDTVTPTSINQVSIGDEIIYEGDRYNVTSKTTNGNLNLQLIGGRTLVKDVELNEIEGWTKKETPSVAPKPLIEQETEGQVIEEPTPSEVAMVLNEMDVESLSQINKQQISSKYEEVFNKKNPNDLALLEALEKAYYNLQEPNIQITQEEAKQELAKLEVISEAIEIADEKSNYRKVANIFKDILSSIKNIGEYAGKIKDTYRELSRGSRGNFNEMTNYFNPTKNVVDSLLTNPSYDSSFFKGLKQAYDSNQLYNFLVENGFSGQDEIFKSLINNGSMNQIIKLKGLKGIKYSASSTPISGSLSESLIQYFNNIIGEGVISTDVAEMNRIARESGYEDFRAMVSAWHGSPFDFDRFTTDAMGTGEGAQAFGWGLYFTDLEGIARNYAETLGRRKNAVDIQTNMFASGLTDNDPRDFAIDIRNELINGKNPKDVAKIIEDKYGVNDKTSSFIRALRDNDVKVSLPKNTSRNLYNVSLHKGKTPDQYTWLEWDKEVPKTQLEKISENVLDKTLAINTTGIFQFKKNEKFYRGEKTNNQWKFIDRNTGESVEYSEVSNAWQELYNQEVLNKKEFKFYKRLEDFLESDKNASLFLLESGIDGIKYPAESIARGATSDTARGFNYVVFDENAITIEKQIKFMQTPNGQIYGMFVPNYNGEPKIFINPEIANNVTLLEELGYMQYYMLDIASKKGDSEAQRILDKGEELFGEIADKWMGLSGSNIIINDKGEGEYEYKINDAIANVYSYGNIISENLPSWAKNETYLSDIKNDGKKGDGKKLIDKIKADAKLSGSDIFTLRADMGLGFSGTDSKLYKYYKDLGFKDNNENNPDGSMYFDLRNYEVSGEGGNADNRFQIIGEKGADALDKAEEATIRLDNLKVAKEMETAGKDAKTIRLATGWEKGADGKWRYEILDVNLKIKQSKATYLGEALENYEELFNAYPDIENIDLILNIDVDNNNSGSFTPFMDRSGEDLFDIQPQIEINAKTIEDANSILVHEIQHAIQHIEGFAKGGNQSSVYNILDLTSNGEIDIDKVEKYINDRIGKITIRRNKLIEEAGGDVTSLESINKVDEYRNLLEQLGKLNTWKTYPTSNVFSYEYYKSLMGETEARNVQTRMNMTAEERRNTLLSETEDVAREDQIILFNALNTPENISESLQKLKQETGVDLTADVYRQGTNETNEAYRKRLIDEIRNKLVAEYGAKSLEEQKGMLQSIKDFFKELYEWFAKQAGLKGQDIEKMTMEEFVEASYNSIMKGEFLQEPNQIMQAISTESINNTEFIKTLKDNGLLEIDENCK